MGVPLEVFYYLVTKILGQLFDVGLDIAEPFGRAHFMKPIHLEHVLGVDGSDDQFAILLEIHTGFDPHLLKRQIGPLGLALRVLDETGIRRRRHRLRF